jgi:hypothetical protein
MKYHDRQSAMRASFLALVALLVAVSAGTVFGQSGRRAPRSSSPAPTPTPEAQPVDKKPVAETKPALTFVVGIDRLAVFVDIPTYFHDSVLRACGERLDASPSVKADIASREMNRGEAIKRAKAETESHVVWLQLRFDSGRGPGQEDLRDLYLEYLVLEPTTGKTVTSGRTYQQLGRTGGVIMMPMPGGRAGLPYTEQLLKQAARDAADRILSSMNLPGRNLPGR